MANKGKNTRQGSLILISGVVQLLVGLLWNLVVAFGSSDPPGGFAIGAVFLGSGAVFLIIGLAGKSKTPNEPDQAASDPTKE